MKVNYPQDTSSKQDEALLQLSNLIKSKTYHSIHSIFDIMSNNNDIVMSDNNNNGISSTLDLSNSGLTANDVVLFQMVLAQNGLHLQRLYLHNNPLGNTGICVLRPVFQKNLRYTITELDLGYTHLTCRGFQMLVESFLGGEEAKSKLQALGVAGNQIVNIDPLIRVLQNAEQNGCMLRKLDLTGNPIGNAGIQALMQAVIYTETCLKPSDNEDISFAMEEDLPQSLSYSQDKVGMQELGLGNTKIDMNDSMCAVSQMLEATSKLQVLSLSHSNVSDHEVHELANSLTYFHDRSVLQKLDLSHNQISCVGIDTFFKSFWGSNHLRMLNFAYNRVGDRGAYILVEALSSNFHISHLFLEYNSISPAGCKALLDSLSNKNTQLQVLDISGNRMDSQSSKVLSNAFSTNSCLEIFSCQNCHVNAADELCITAGLLVNPSTKLKELNGFLLSPRVIQMGFPSILNQWTNRQVLKFFRYMWERYSNRVQKQNSKGSSGGYSSINDNKTNNAMEVETPVDFSQNSQKVDMSTAKKVAHAAMKHLEEFGHLEMFCNDNDDDMGVGMQQSIPIFERKVLSGTNMKSERLHHLHDHRDDNHARQSYYDLFDGTEKKDEMEIGIKANDDEKSIINLTQVHKWKEIQMHRLHQYYYSSDNGHSNNITFDHDYLEPSSLFIKDESYSLKRHIYIDEDMVEHEQHQNPFKRMRRRQINDI